MFAIDSSGMAIPGLRVADQELYLTFDSIINGISYKTIETEGDVTFTENDSGIEHYWGAFDGVKGFYRKDGMQVMYIPWGSDQEELLYEFDLQVGDTLEQSYINPFVDVVVSSIDTVQVDGQNHRRFSVAGADLPTQVIIEGIGASKGLLESLAIAFDWADELICFGRNGAPLFPAENAECNVVQVSVEDYGDMQQFKVFPNPVGSAGRFSIGIVGDGRASYEIFDGFGRIIDDGSITASQNTVQMSPQLPNGMYLLRISIDAKPIKSIKLVIDR